MYLEIRHLRSIQAINTHKKLSAAADALCVTQSALSHQIKNLEETFNAELFFRKSRPLKLTPAGESLLKLANEIIPLVLDAEKELKQISLGTSGRLHIAIECHSCFEWLIPSMDNFKIDWPEVSLDLSFGFAFDPFPALLDGKLDLVVSSDPVDIDGIAFLPLFDFKMQLAVPLGHKFIEKGFVVPEDLEDETLITYPVDRERLDIYRGFLDPAGVTPKESRTAEMTIMMIQLVNSNCGIASLPSWAIHEYIERNRVAAVDLGKGGYWGTLYAAIREKDLQTPYMNSFVDIAKNTSLGLLFGVRDKK
ncbi:MAG: LysR family transcriptional regulator [Gammaproteobacteria bacterium]|nr:MAG: LysR family transcriptional regulator [Gammaproteobacteria bacterium]